MTKPKPKPEQPKVEDLDQQEKDDLAEANAPADETTADLARWIAAQDDPAAAKAALDELAGNEVGVSNDPGAGDQEQRDAAEPGAPGAGDSDDVAAGNGGVTDTPMVEVDGSGRITIVLEPGEPNEERLSLYEAKERGMQVAGAPLLQQLIDAAEAPDPLRDLEELDLEGITDRMVEVDVDFERVDVAVLGDEPASVRAAYLRAVIRAHLQGEPYPPAADWVEDEPALDVADTEALAAATTPAPEPEPATDGLQEFRGVANGEMVRVKPTHKLDGEPSVYAGHTGRVIEIIEEATHVDEGCPFLVDFGESGRQATSFHRDEIDRVVEL